MNESAILTRGLTKAFPDGAVGLDHLDLEVPVGSVFGLLGRNGAGKSTLLRVLMGVLRADAGTAEVLGEDLSLASATHRARVSYVAQEPRLVGRFSLAEHARLFRHLYPRFDPLLARNLAERLDVDWKRKSTGLSGGARRKAAVLLAVASGAEVLLLDEPSAGLDPVAHRALVDVLVELLAQGEPRTLVLSTHLVGDLERLADHVAFVDQGRVVRCDTVDHLTSSFRRVQVVFEGSAPSDFTIPGALRAVREGCMVRAVTELSAAADLEAVLSAARSEGGARVEEFPLGLEDVFIELLGGPREGGQP